MHDPVEARRIRHFLAKALVLRGGVFTIAHGFILVTATVSPRHWGPGFSNIFYYNCALVLLAEKTCKTACNRMEICEQ